ncbi:MAG: SUMF1/EgtB/PvdO family nonheme iron enzyme [Treponema sp.]|jgi:formylglycine-generating enzyme required for sulfatase activity|nr:SUMF1/EgtB/PvdO family nonheme iron enzyme [Treponema sp.]
MKRIISWVCGLLLIALLGACLTNGSPPEGVTVGTKFARMPLDNPSYAFGAFLDEESYGKAPFKESNVSRGGKFQVPESYSLKEYAPIPGNQGPLGSCVSWASGYAARTIMESVSLKRKDTILTTKNAFSPLFLYYALRQMENRAPDEDGALIDTAMAFLKQYGAIRRSDFDESGAIDLSSFNVNIEDYRRYPILEFGKLFDMNASTAAFRIDQVKSFVYDDCPVVIGCMVTPSFMDVKDVWQPEADEGMAGAHAVCVVGYDDNKYGGAFEIMNSHGEEWGNGGFGWIPYSVFGDYVTQAWCFSGDIAADNAPLEYTARVRIDMEKDQKEIPVRLTAEGLYQPAATLEKGAGFRLVIDNSRSSARYPVYAYVFYIDDNKTDLVQVWPEGNNPASLEARRNSIPIPTGGKWISAGGALARRDFILLYSYSELNVPDFMKAFKTKTGTVQQRVSAAGGAKFIPYNRVKYEYASASGTADFHAKDDVMGLVFSAVFGSEKGPADMIRIKGGSFTMGSPASETGRDNDEVLKKITLKDFYIGAGELTVGAFREFAAAANYKTTAEKNGYSVLYAYPYDGKQREGINWMNPGYVQEDNQPVVHISWFDAIEYCNWRSKQEGFKPVYTVTGGRVVIDAAADGYRLPTEAEWEYACRAGTTTPYNTGKTIDNRTVNFVKTYQFRMTPAGRYAPNAWGLYDAHGNILEWCQDYYDEKAGVRSIRSSFWLDEDYKCRSAYRMYASPEATYGMVGFRLARTAK